MIIKVTQECINKGKRKDARFCPVACALKDNGITTPVLVGGRIYKVSPDSPYSTPNDEYTLIAPMPQSVKDFINAFDNVKKVVQPFEFEVDIEPYL